MNVHYSKSNDNISRIINASKIITGRDSAAEIFSRISQKSLNNSETESKRHGQDGIDAMTKLCQDQTGPSC